MKVKPQDLKKTLLLTDIDQNGFHFEDTRIFAGQVGSSLKPVVSTDYIPKKGDKIYFMEGCTVPRAKVKMYYSKFDVSGTNQKDKADVIFVGPKSVSDFFSYLTTNTITKANLVKWMEIITSKYDTRVMKLKGQLHGISEDEVIIIRDYSDCNVLRGALPNPFTNTLITGDMVYKYYSQISEENYQSLVDMCNPNSKYYDQDCILKELNETIIDKDIYAGLVNMFESSDRDNHVAAMEIMANCDYEKSAVYILLLFHKFGYKIYESRTRHHINFKSLLEFFGIKSSFNNLNIDGMITVLSQKKLLTKTNLNFLMPMVNDLFNNYKPSEYFEISKIEGTKELNEQIIDDEVIIDENIAQLEQAQTEPEIINAIKEDFEV